MNGGLEIPCKTSASIPGACLCKELYVQPKEELILGSFLNFSHGCGCPILTVYPTKNQEKKEERYDEGKCECNVERH